MQTPVINGTTRLSRPPSRSQCNPRAVKPELAGNWPDPTTLDATAMAALIAKTWSRKGKGLAAAVVAVARTSANPLQRG